MRAEEEERGGIFRLLRSENFEALSVVARSSSKLSQEFSHQVQC